MRWFLALAAISGLAQGETCVTLDSTRYYYRRMESNRAEIQLRLEHDSSRNVLKIFVRTSTFLRGPGCPGKYDFRWGSLIMNCESDYAMYDESTIKVQYTGCLFTNIQGGFNEMSAEFKSAMSVRTSTLLSADLQEKPLKETISCGKCNH